jgi:hypothetical protein
MGEGRGVYRALTGRPEGKRPLGRLSHKWEDNIKLDLRETGIEGEMGSQNRVQWWAFANSVMKFRVP